MWVHLGESHEQLLNPVAILDLEDEGERQHNPSQPSPDLKLRKVEFVDEVRRHWLVWQGGIERFKEAISKITDFESAPSRLAARLALVDLTRLFFPPLILMPNEKPGDQLLRPAGPLFCRPGGRTTLTGELMEGIVGPIADFSDLMSTFDLRPMTDQYTDLDRESNWTVTRLCSHLTTSETTIANWRKVTSPLVAGRAPRQPFTFSELAQLAQAALQMGHFDAAESLGRLATLRDPP